MHFKIVVIGSAYHYFGTISIFKKRVHLALMKNVNLMVLKIYILLMVMFLILEKRNSLNAKLYNNVIVCLPNNKNIS